MSSGGSRYRELADTAEQKCDGVTEGPWLAWFNQHGDPYVVTPAPEGAKSPVTGAPALFAEYVATPSTAPDDYGRANCEFIAWSRSGVPELVAALREADAEIEKLRASLTEQTDKHDLERHQPQNEPGPDGPGACAYCWRPWPCRGARARAALGVSIQEPETSQK